MVTIFATQPCAADLPAAIDPALSSHQLDDSNQAVATHSISAHLCVMRVRQHLLRLVAAAAAAQQAHANTCCLTRHCIVHVEHILQVFKYLLITSAQGSQPYVTTPTTSGQGRAAAPSVDVKPAQGSSTSSAIHCIAAASVPMCGDVDNDHNMQQLTTKQAMQRHTWLAPCCPSTI